MLELHDPATFLILNKAPADRESSAAKESPRLRSFEAIRARVFHVDRAFSAETLQERMPAQRAKD